jgi:hypothetical protein
MNRKRLAALAEWLEQGAPGIAFNIYCVREPIAQVLGPEGDPLDAEMVRRQIAEKSLTHSDLCCGLEGATVQVFDPGFPLYAPEHSFLVQDHALALLDLPRMDKGPQWDCAHDLFDPTHAPENCRPETAAQAVWRLYSGADPWPAIV